MRSNLSELECKQVDALHKLNDESSVLESASLQALLVFLIEQVDEQEVRYCLDEVTNTGEFYE